MKKLLIFLILTATQITFCMELDRESSDEESSKSAKVRKNKAPRGGSTKKQCHLRYVCDDSPCEQTDFKSPSQYTNHIRHQHILKEKKCPGCGYAKSEIGALVAHILECDTEKAKLVAAKIQKADIPQRCNKCSGIFSYIGDKNNHETECTGEKSSKQKNTGQVCTARCNLKCIDDDSICGIVYSLIANKHKKEDQHISRNFKCPCGIKTGDRLNNYVQHLKNCQNAEAQKIYQKIKTSDIPQRCNTCDFYFSKTQALRIHKKSIHGKPNKQSAAGAAAAADEEMSEESASEENEAVSAASAAASAPSPMQAEIDGGSEYEEESSESESDEDYGKATKRKPKETGQAGVKRKKQSSLTYRIQCPLRYASDDSPCDHNEFDSQVNFGHHKNYQHVLKEKKCPGCGFARNSLLKVVAHISECETAEAKIATANIEKADIPQRCNKCRTIFSYINDKKNHEKKCNGEKSKLIKKPESAAIIACNLQYLDEPEGSSCGKRSDAVYIATVHKLDQHITRSFTCPCGAKTGDRIESYMQHLKNCHNDDAQNLYKKIQAAKIAQQCNSCDTYFSSVSSMRSHKKSCSKLSAKKVVKQKEKPLTPAVAAAIGQKLIADQAKQSAASSAISAASSFSQRKAFLKASSAIQKQAGDKSDNDSESEADYETASKKRAPKKLKVQLENGNVQAQPAVVAVQDEASNEAPASVSPMEEASASSASNSGQVPPASSPSHTEAGLELRPAQPQRRALFILTDVQAEDSSLQASENTPNYGFAVTPSIGLLPGLGDANTGSPTAQEQIQKKTLEDLMLDDWLSRPLGASNRSNDTQCNF